MRQRHRTSCTPAVRLAAMLVAAAVALGMWPGAAGAGDIARPVLIGFSLDGRYVAFEDYGTFNEGLPYSIVHVIDVAANAWVPGSPIRVELDFDDAEDWSAVEDEVGMARDRAMAAAQPLLDRHGIVAGETGTTLIHHPLSDLTAPDHVVDFAIDAAFSPYGGDRQTLTVTERPITGHACDAQDLGQVAMMSLELYFHGYDRLMILQEDTTLPESRGCATGYRIHSVIVYAPGLPEQAACCYEELVMLVLVDVASFGFEGEDRRHMGVTTVLPRVW